MPFPASFPTASCDLLVHVLTSQPSDGHTHDARQVVEAGYDVLGYVLAEMLGSPQPTPVGAAAPQTNEEKAALLEQAKAHADATAKPAKGKAKTAAVGAVPWSLIFELVKQLIEEFLVKK